MYVRSQGETSNPLLQKILVAFNKKIGFSDSLGGALDQVFGTSTPTGSTTPTTGTSGGSPSPTPSPGSSPSSSPPASGSPQAALQAALGDASQALQDGQAALAKGDFAAYGVAQTKLKDAITRAIEAQRQLGVTSSGATVPSATGGAGTTSKPAPSPTG